MVTYVCLEIVFSIDHQCKIQSEVSDLFEQGRIACTSPTVYVVGKSVPNVDMAGGDGHVLGSVGKRLVGIHLRFFLVTLSLSLTVRKKIYIYSALCQGTIHWEKDWRSSQI